VSSANAEVRLVTDDGRALKLRMTRQVMEECATCFSAANLRAIVQARSADRVPGIPAAAEAVAPAAGHVVMTLSLLGVGATLFVLSPADALVLAAQLLDAATLGRDEVLPQ
jgi:hypothetical protein